MQIYNSYPAFQSYITMNSHHSCSATVCSVPVTHEEMVSELSNLRVCTQKNTEGSQRQAKHEKEEGIPEGLSD